MIKKEINSTPPLNHRREFIKNAGLVASGIVVVPRNVLGGKGFLAPSDQLIIASVGVGGKGGSDIANFYGSGKAAIGYLCDVDERRAANSVKKFPQAKYYKDWRVLFDKESKNFDAVSVSTPDHNHAIISLSAMQLGKHVYVQKPLTHDIYEARKLTEAAKKYKVVTQMGNQGASGDGVRQLQEWYNAGVIGDVHTVYCWTDRPIWPQGIPWSSAKADIPKELDWDLWLGTAPYKEYVEKLVPFSWRGWWDYGTGALGDMGCHLIEAPFRVLELKYPTDVECSVGSIYVDQKNPGYFPDSCPPSSHVIMAFPAKQNKPSVKLHWMDGGIQPERPDELGPNEMIGPNGVIFIGTKGKMMCKTYGKDPKLLPLSRNNEVKIKHTIPLVPGGEAGHYTEWVEASIAGFGKKELSSDFAKAGPLTETVLMGNLAIRSYNIQRPKKDGKGMDYPGRYIKMLWDGANMKITNFDEANQFVKRQYRNGWNLDI